MKTACYKQFRLIDDRVLPGTLNGQCVLPTVTQALIFIGVVNVDPVTLISMMAAAAAGAAWGARYVASFDRQTIRLVMAVPCWWSPVSSLPVCSGSSPRWRGHGAERLQAGDRPCRQLPVRSSDERRYRPVRPLHDPGLSARHEPAGGLPHHDGIHRRAQRLLGGDLHSQGAFDARAVLAVAIFGPIGVVLAAMLVKSMEMEMLKWLVAFIVIYTSWTMYASWRAARRQPAPALAEATS